ncbi:hypothetical protein PFMALIP_02946 [Plasmodium falciparum MaliPS096_E11]|uniref:Uncharacterized protein n=1 Tax=Plasmodium falciparum MaliPS096_E11 TaxID=1036727 RepID=A0A024WP40_PLAFA|nr:hypothetical protein PFMALIP_02946 [Plasmodium falciparum MaliPS096_E11]
MDNNNIVYIEKKTKEKKKEEKEKNKEFDSFHMKNIFLLVIHFLFYIILVHIYYTYNNENLLQCFNNSFSYILKSPYLNIYDVEIIQNNLSNISQMCNHDKLNYSKYIDTDYFKYSFLFYNQHVNTYIDYVIIFHKLNQSEILKKEIHISITKYFFWKEWVLYIFFNLMTCAIINIYWKKKERKENIFHVSVISLININIIYQQFIDSTKLENYKSIIEDNKGRIKYYDAYSILYNFEYSLSLLIRTSFKVQHYGVFKKDKEIFVHEIYEDNYNNMYNYKYILLIIMFIITIIYLILTIFMVYYIRSKIYISFFSFFFLNFFFFFLFHFMSFTPVSYFYDYINDIKENQISEIFNNMNKQDNFRSLLFDLLKIKWYKFYANLFSYIIILTSLLNFFFLFFINHISFLIKHKKKFLLVSIPIWISVFFMSLIGSYFPCNIQKNIFKWILLFYQIQTNQNSFPYEVLNKFIFVFFLFYLTSIFLFIYVKKKPNIIKLKRRNYQNDKDPKQVPFNNTNICENYDILLYFKALLYSLDKTFEKVQLLKEKNKFSQMLNLQINMYNMYEQQKMMLQYGNINAQGNYMNGQTNNVMNGQGNNYMNGQKKKKKKN